jgi:hypothetical protein
MPLLSIVIINWNTRELLRNCLDSVFRNPPALGASVIVVDNGSTDGSVQMVETDFVKVTLIRNNDNRGFAAANNQALQIIDTKYVLLLNSDTLIHGNVLDRSIEYMERNLSVGIMGCRVLNGDGTVQRTCSQFPSFRNLLLMTVALDRLPWPKFLGRYRMRDWERDTEREVEVVSGCFMMVRHAAIIDVGVLDESFFFFGEETDWCRRFIKSGWRVAFSPVGEITHYGGGTCKSLNFRRDVLLTQATIHLHRKYGGPAKAVLVWFLLFLFNLSRALFWQIARFVSNEPKAKERARHFRQVSGRTASTWKR